MTIRIEGGLVLRDRAGGLTFEAGDIVIESDRISRVGAGPELRRIPADRIIDGRDRLVIPGLVNAHTHSYGNLVRGEMDGLPLEPWFPYAAAAAANRGEREVYVSTLLGCIELLRTGTSSVLDHLSASEQGLGTAAQAYLDAGLRVALAPMVSDLPSYEALPLEAGDLSTELLAELDAQAVPTRADLVASLRRLATAWHGRAGRISIFPGPSGPQRCSDDFLASCRDLAEEFDTGIHTHLLESRLQAAMADRRYGGSMVGHLENLGLLSPRLSAAHAVWVTQADVELLAARGVSVVHNPQGNLTLGSGVAPLPALLAAGVNVALGTDAASCSPNQNLFEAMRLAATLHRVGTPPDGWPTPGQALRMATSGGGRALREENLGKIQAGSLADLVLIDARSPSYVPANDLPRQLVYGESGRGVDTVLIGGQVVLDHGRITTFDEAAVLHEAAELAPRLRARNEPLYALAARQQSKLLNLWHRYSNH